MRGYVTKFVPLNCIVVDPRNPNYLATGGREEFAKLYDTRMCRRGASSNYDYPMKVYCPDHLINRGRYIGGLAFSNTSELLVSYIGESIYLFQKNMGLNISSLTSEDANSPEVYSGHINKLEKYLLYVNEKVKFFGPNCEYVVSGSGCGRVFIWKKKGAEVVQKLVSFGVKQILPHPHMPYMAIAGGKIRIWTPMLTDIPGPRVM